MSILKTIFFVLLATTSSQSTTSLKISLIDPCTVAIFPLLCRGTIKGETNVNTATVVAIRELIKRTNQAKGVARKEVKTNGGVASCLSNFNSALHNLDKSLKNIKENDRFSLNINLSAALTDYDTCSEAMKETKEIHVVYKSAGVLFQMADNCLVLSTLIKQ